MGRTANVEKLGEGGTMMDSGDIELFDRLVSRLEMALGLLEEELTPADPRDWDYVKIRVLDDALEVQVRYLREEVEARRQHLLRQAEARGRVGCVVGGVGGKP